jgi:hypothetical protein
MPGPRFSTPQRLYQFLCNFLKTVIESPLLARLMSEAFDKQVPNDAHSVQPAADGHDLESIERANEGNKKAGKRHPIVSL